MEQEMTAPHECEHTAGESFHVAGDDHPLRVGRGIAGFRPLQLAFGETA